MGGVIWTDDKGLIGAIPVEYAYADAGKLFYAEYSSKPSVSGASITMFIETGATNTAQGSICVYSTSECTVRLLQLPASGTSNASIALSDKTAVTTYNLDRYRKATAGNLTNIYIGSLGRWKREDACNVLQTIQGSGSYPVDSIRARTYWLLDSQCTYALTTRSTSADNYITVSYTWNETTI